MSIGDRLTFLLITGFGTGLAPVASGTFGTLPAVVIGLCVQRFAVDDNSTLAIWLAILAAVLLAFGCSVTGFVDRVLKVKDPKPFVLDEIVGYFVTLAMVAAVVEAPLTLYHHGAVFFFFRLFDVLKISPARELEGLQGAPGIMLDDVAAGVQAGLVVWAMLYFELFQYLEFFGPLPI